MDNQSGPFGHRGSLKDALRYAGPSARSRLRRGFDLLSDNASKTEEVVAAVKGTFSGAESPPPSEDPQSQDDWNAVLSAGSLLVMALVVKNETVEKIQEELKSAELIEAPGPGFARFIQSAQKHQATLKSAWERARLVSEVLPALMAVETTVDLRFGFDGEKIEYSAPIMLVHLDTDAYGQEMWFQLTRPQLESFIEDLKKGLAKMKSAEAWKPIA